MTVDGLSIGEVARRAGVRASAIRYYESIGVLPEPERVAGRRRYDEDVVRRLATIAAARRAGLSLDDIRELLAAGPGTSARLRRVARRKLPEADALVEHARLVREWLAAAADCACPTLDDCPLFDEYAPG